MYPIEIHNICGYKFISLRIKNKLSDCMITHKKFLKNICKDIAWKGSRFYINAQLVTLFVLNLNCYMKGEIALETFFSFLHMLDNQKRVKLYQPLLQEIQDLPYLENCIKNGRVNKNDTIVVTYCVELSIKFFTENMKKVRSSLQKNQKPLL